MSRSEEAAEKLLIALDLHEAGVQTMRENLRRRFPDASAERIEEMLVAWLQTRPGAEHGDGVGIPGDLRRFLTR